MEQRRTVQRMITQSGYNPRRGSIRRTRVIPVGTERIEQIMTTVQPIIVEEQSTTERIEDIVENLERLVITEEQTDEIEELESMDVDTAETQSDISAELEEKRSSIRQEIATVTRADLASFYRKFFSGITNMTKGQLLYIYSIYLQLDDEYLSTFLAEMRDLFENPDQETMSIYNDSIVLIPPTISRMDGITTLIINGTNVEELPVEIADMPDINTVILIDNKRLTRIPDAVQPLVVYQ